MNDTGHLPERDVANIDQFAAIAAEMAQIIAYYYLKLIENDVPQSAASVLTEHFAVDIWAAIMKQRE